MTRITELAAASNVGSADVLPMVDLSDTGMAGSGTTKKVTPALLRNAGTVLDSAYAGGADRSGVADSTAAFAAAISAGGKKHVPAGTYLLDAAQLAPPSGLHLEGDGYDSTVINCVGAGAYFMNLDNAGGQIDDLLITGLTINATGMDIFWGANLTRARITGNQFNQLSGGNYVMNVSATTGLGSTYLAECEFANKEVPAVGTRSVPSWLLDFSGSGNHGNDNLWHGGGNKIWTMPGAVWLLLVGDSTQRRSCHNTFRDLVFECSGGTGGFIHVQNTRHLLIDAISSEDLTTHTITGALIIADTYASGPGCDHVVISNYSRRGGNGVGSTYPDVLLDANATNVTIRSPGWDGVGGALTVDAAGTTPVLEGSWPAGYVLLNSTGNLGPPGNSRATVVAFKRGTGQTTAQTLSWTPPAANCRLRVSLFIQPTTAGTSTVPVLTFTQYGGGARTLTIPMWQQDGAATAPSYLCAAAATFAASVYIDTDSSATPVALTITPTGSTFRYSATIERLT